MGKIKPVYLPLNNIFIQDGEDKERLCALHDEFIPRQGNKTSVARIDSS